jgi:hypothetical protein
MKRILLLVTVALMLAAAMALSGVAQAASPSARCQAEAESLGISGSYKFIGGNKSANDFTRKATEGADVFCGFGGNDSIFRLEEGDIFLAGDGLDQVEEANLGTYYGGAGDDFVYSNVGTFYGGADNDDVVFNNATGTFYGGAGNDEVSNINFGTFYGEAGDDFVGSGNFPVDGSP